MVKAIEVTMMQVCDYTKDLKPVSISNMLFPFTLRLAREELGRDGGGEVFIKDTMVQNSFKPTTRCNVILRDVKGRFVSFRKMANRPKLRAAIEALPLQ